MDQKLIATLQERVTELEGIIREAYAEARGSEIYRDPFDNLVKEVERVCTELGQCAADWDNEHERAEKLEAEFAAPKSRVERAEGRIAHIQAQEADILRSRDDGFTSLTRERDEARRERDEARAERDELLLDEKAYLRNEDDLKSAIRWRVAELEASKRREAAMREALKAVDSAGLLEHGFDCLFHVNPKGCDCSRDELPWKQVAAALASDAGKDFVPRAVAQGLADALRGLLRDEWNTYEGNLEAHGHASVDDLNCARETLAAYERATK